MKNQILVGACAAAALLSGECLARPSTLYSNTMRSGPVSEWVTASGFWDWTGAGLKTALPTENRIFLWNGMSALSEYKMSFTVTRNAGPGWSAFFRTGITNGWHVSGYSFGYDGGYGSGAYVLRSYADNVSAPLMPLFAPADAGPHVFDLIVKGDLFEAYRDGQLLMSRVDTYFPAGYHVGFATPSGADAVFSDFALLAIPAPGAGVCAAGVAGALGLRRRRPR